MGGNPLLATGMIMMGISAILMGAALSLTLVCLPVGIPIMVLGAICLAQTKQLEG
jgi:hypothetical protein